MKIIFWDIMSILGIEKRNSKELKGIAAIAPKQAQKANFIPWKTIEELEWPALLGHLKS